MNFLSNKKKKAKKTKKSIRSVWLFYSLTASKCNSKCVLFWFVLYCRAGANLCRQYRKPIGFGSIKYFQWDRARLDRCIFLSPIFFITVFRVCVGMCKCIATIITLFVSALRHTFFYNINLWSNTQIRIHRRKIAKRIDKTTDRDFAYGQTNSCVLGRIHVPCIISLNINRMRSSAQCSTERTPANHRHRRAAAQTESSRCDVSVKSSSIHE